MPSRKTIARSESCEEAGTSGWRANGDSMDQMFDLVRKIAPSNASVLITGEAGTGQELIARTIHRLSPRSSNAFVAFSCANLPDTVVDEELFGHDRDAFMGATTSRRGRFDAADGGTLFLDEIGDLSLPLQAKLLRVLQERTFERLGGVESLKADVRVVCATRRDLPEMVKQGTFREDLYHRVNAVGIHLPPLRERRQGIALLANHFLEQAAKEFGRAPMYFSSLVVTALKDYNWPGNIRELENVIRRAVLMAEGSAIELAHLPLSLSIGFRTDPPFRPIEFACVREFNH
jgi:transcriptional regulator with GAF, ATPase, and Fis domain